MDQVSHQGRHINSSSNSYKVLSWCTAMTVLPCVHSKEPGIWEYAMLAQCFLQAEKSCSDWLSCKILLVVVSGA
jgi:hypothetical protein